MQYPSRKYLSTPLERFGFNVMGLLILLGLIGLVLVPKPAAASSGAFQEDSPTFTLEIKYQNPVAGQVELVWGLNGWSLAPEEERPTGTVVEGDVLHTPMLKEEGIFVGISSGAALAAVAKKLPDIPAGSRILTFNYDTGERYLSVEDLF